jgi:GPR1/FUN34/yaaH family
MMSSLPENKRTGDLEANSGGYDTRESADTRTDTHTYHGTDSDHKHSFRQFANPAPLGLCGFALTTFVLSLCNVHARSVTIPNVVIGLGIIPREIVS